MANSLVSVDIPVMSTTFLSDAMMKDMPYFLDSDDDETSSEVDESGREDLEADSESFRDEDEELLINGDAMSEGSQGEYDEESQFSDGSDDEYHSEDESQYYHEGEDASQYSEEGEEGSQYQEDEQEYYSSDEDGHY